METGRVTDVTVNLEWLAYAEEAVTVLFNLETHNAQMIREGRSKAERFQILKEIAEYQLNVLKAAEKIKLIEERT